MKKRVLILILAALLLVTVPAAASAKEPIGDRISVYVDGSFDYFAGTPFHIRHGWADVVSSAPPGTFDFELYVDGVFVDEDFVIRTFDTTTNPVFYNFTWVHNFPSGMTGTHTFNGYWYGPCNYLVELGLYPGPCPQPNARVLAHSTTVVVTFIE